MKLKQRWTPFWVTSLFFSSAVFLSGCFSQQQQQSQDDLESTQEEVQGEEQGNNFVEDDELDNLDMGLEQGNLDELENEMFEADSEQAMNESGNDDLSEALENNNEGAEGSNLLASEQSENSPLVQAQDENFVPYVGGSAGQPAGLGLPEMGAKLSYVVVKGDTLGKISKRIYGTSRKWKELAELSGFANPSIIYPGDITYYQLNEASLEFAAKNENISRQEVVVQQGDTLGKIARRVYGNSSNWKHIWRQNGQVANPDKLEIGTKLYLSDYKHSFAQVKVIKEMKKIVKISRTKEDLKKLKRANLSIQKSIKKVATLNQSAV